MEENKYQRGKIYKIISPYTDKIYIGSTTEIYLSRRFAKHKSNFINNYKDRYCSSFIIFDFGDVEIVLIETYSCSSKDELHSRERYYIELNKDIVVNKKTPMRKKKEYIEDNKEHLAMKKKEHYQKNKDEIKKYKKEWHQIKYNCECGTIISQGNKCFHLKSEKHQTYELIQTL